MCKRYFCNLKVYSPIVIVKMEEDKQIIKTVYKHISKKEPHIGSFLYNLRRRFRFAGYIGSIMYLDDEIKDTKSAIYLLFLLQILNFIFIAFLASVVSDKDQVVAVHL